jgi:hypothetical protein
LAEPKKQLPSKGKRDAKRHPLTLKGVLRHALGKYLSRLHKLHQVIAPKEGFEAQLRAARVPITFGMRALGMTSQIHDGRLYRVIEAV